MGMCNLFINKDEHNKQIIKRGSIMGKIYNLREATMLIWETVKITEEQGGGIKHWYISHRGIGK